MRVAGFPTPSLGGRIDEPDDVTTGPQDPDLSRYEPMGRDEVTVSRSRPIGLETPAAQISVDVDAVAGGTCGREEMGLLRLTLAIL
jgi:hypothetical protein